MGRTSSNGTSTREHPLEVKARSIASSHLGSSPAQTSEITGVPVRTIQYWLSVFETWNDSELEAFIAAKKRALGAAWIVMEQDCLEFAASMLAAGNANGLYRAIWSAGVSHDKTLSLGQPKTIDASSITPTRLSDPPPSSPPIAEDSDSTIP
jgi:hypothetical protein